MKKTLTRGGAIALTLALAPAATATAATATANSIDPALLSSPSSTNNHGERVEEDGYTYYEPGSAHGSSIGSSPISGAVFILGVLAAGSFLVNEVPEIASAIGDLTEAIGSAELSSSLEPLSSQLLSS